MIAVEVESWTEAEVWTEAWTEVETGTGAGMEAAEALVGW